MSDDAATTQGADPSRRPPPRPVDLSAAVQTALSGAASGRSIATGFPSLDNLLGGGFRRGDVAVLGGDVGVGKSSFALAVALRSAAAGHTVAFLSGEMTATRIMERALALQGRARIDDLRRGTFAAGTGDGPAAAAAVLRDGRPVLAQLPDTGTAGVSDFLVEHLGLELVVVDSLQYVATGPRSLDDELAAAARALKELAMRRSTSVLVVTHLGRSLRDRPNPRPQLDDFGGYGAIRQQADMVLGLFREEVYAESPHVEGAAELHVLKNRNGPVGFVDLYFYKQWMRFEDMVEPDA